jgi:hypothetical protein
MWMNFPALYANMLCFVNALVTGHVLKNSLIIHEENRKEINV